MRERRIGALDRPRPEPSNDGEFLADERFEVGPFLRHLRRDFHWRIEMADALLCFVAHPSAVVAHVFREALGSRPVGQGFLLFTFLLPLLVYRRPARELGWDFNHGLVDEHGHGVEVTRVSLQPQSLRLQRDGTATGKGIVQGGQFVGIEQLGGLRVVLVQLAHLTPGAAYLGAGTLQHFFVGGVLP